MNSVRAINFLLDLEEQRIQKLAPIQKLRLRNYSGCPDSETHLLQGGVVGWGDVDVRLKLQANNGEWVGWVSGCRLAAQFVPQERCAIQ